MRKDFRGFLIDDRTLVRPREPPWPPRYSLGPPLAERLRNLERLEERLRSREFSPEAWRRLLREALSRNAYATASIEGNPLSLEDVRSLLAKAPTPSNLLEPDEREIINFARIVETVGRHRPPRRVDDIQRLHAEYFEGVLKRPGQLKDHQNAVVTRAEGRVQYLASGAAKVRRELQAALDWWSESDETPLAKAAIFFHEFQSIHPFADGNGRLGRLIATIQLWHTGYPGIRAAFLDYSINEDREAYYAALDAARAPGWDRTPWLAYFIPTIEDAYRRALRRADLLASLPRALKERQVRLVEWISRASRADPRRRFKLADLHEAFPTAPLRTLSYDLAFLVEHQVLERTGERKAARYRLAARLHRRRRAGGPG